MQVPLETRSPVVQVELADWLTGPAFAPATVLHEVAAAGAVTAVTLVRLHGEPVGLVVVPLRDGIIMREHLVHALLETHLDALGRTLAGRVLDAGPAAAARTERMPLADWLQTPPSPSPRDGTAATGDAPPLITVAVCTRNRPADLDRCLAALRALRYPALDLLVVDNAPTDRRTARVVERHPGVRVVTEPRQGLDWARNRAIAECRGDILAFTDDDVVVDPGWVDAIAQVFASDPAVMAVTGLVLPLELETRAQRRFEIYGGFARGVRRRWIRARPGYPAALEWGGTGSFGTGANMAFRRRVFMLVGGFDPALDVGTPTNGGGDLEMFFRVVKHGHTLVYEPSAIVRHRHRQDEAALRAQIANNGIGFYACLARTALAYPDERVSVLRFALWWFRWWSLRRLVNRLRGREPVPLSLILGELVGSLRGPFRYLAARRHARAVAHRHPGARTVSVTPSVAPPDTRLTREAVRRVDLAEPLQALTGLADARRVRVFVFRRGVPVGRVVIDSRGADVSRLQLRDAIAATLTTDMLEPLRHPQPDRAWRRLADAVRTTLLPGVPRTSDAATPGTVAVRGADPPVPSSMPVSVVIATCDRPDDLRACLASLTARQTPRPVEIVVVDNRPASGLTPTVVREFPGVRLLEEPRAGLSYARNRGILAATGDIILTTDDDVVCPPDWIEALVQPFARPEVMIVTGNVLPLEMETSAQQLFETYGGLGRGYRTFEADTAWFRAHRRSVPTWQLGCTANAAFRATIFSDDRIGLMDEALGAGTPTGCSEDTYTFYRVLAAGYTLVYEPQAYVWHRHRQTVDALRRQIHSYSKGHVAYHLTTWLVDGDRRALVRLGYELPASYARRALLRLARRSDYPLRLLALEILGTMAGPWALWQSRRRVRRLGPSRAPSAMSEQNRAMPPLVGRET